jgi:hypothetical protein
MAKTAGRFRQHPDYISKLGAQPAEPPINKALHLSSLPFSLMPLQLSVVLELLRRQLDDDLSSPVESLEGDHLHIILAQRYLSGHIDSLCAIRSTQDLSVGDAP